MSLSHARRLAKTLERMGFDSVEIGASNVSGSAYITAGFGDEDDRETVKIRLSSHELPPSYDARDADIKIDLGPHMGATHESVSHAIVWLAERFDLAPPPASVRAVDRADEKQREREAIIEAREERERKNLQREYNAAIKVRPDLAHLDGIVEIVNAIMEERGVDHLTGSKRKKQRQKIRKQLLKGLNS